jgi:putative NADH-flavin reductase
MNVVIVGANGGTGRCLVERALAEGHQVTAAVRSPSAANVARERLRIVACDVLEPRAVAAALAGQDMVFCALGTHRGATTLYSTGARNLAAGMRAQGVRRLAFLSNFGVLGEKAEGLQQALLLFVATRMLRHTLADHRRALDVLREQVPEWIAVRPLPLTNGPGTGNYRIAIAGLPAAGMRIARADVADFMLRQATGNDYLSQAPAIAY